ncbi:MAG: DUF2306 domain-containing protein [Roseateles sp.]|uniref:DUF2306 domain-containing protein n=1 Tax=Roseateles sp. TaxID=1971397 RepID=UPI004035D141
MNTANPSRFARRLGFALLLLTAWFIGMAALRYALPGPPFAPPLPNLATQRELLVLHAVAGGLALMLGPWQFVKRLREQRPGLHRAIGWGYASSLLVGGLTALPLALQANGGPLAQLGFGLLGLLWLATTAIALVHIRARRVAAHRRWMLRSFVLTAGGITLRLQILAGSAFDVPVEAFYTALAWTSWLPQALWLEWWLWRSAPGAPQPEPSWPDTQLDGG